MCCSARRKRNRRVWVWRGVPRVRLRVSGSVLQPGTGARVRSALQDGLLLQRRAGAQPRRGLRAPLRLPALLMTPPAPCYSTKYANPLKRETKEYKWVFLLSLPLCFRSLATRAQRTLQRVYRQLPPRNCHHPLWEKSFVMQLPADERERALVRREEERARRIFIKTKLEHENSLLKILSPSPKSLSRLVK